MTDYALIPKIMPALRRLRVHYEQQNEPALCKLIECSSVFIEPGTEYDNWNGGTYGHDAYLFVPEELMGLVSLDDQEAIFERIREDLNKATPEVENEYIRAAFVIPEEVADPKFQAAVPFTKRARLEPAQVEFWHSNYLRVFISHKAEHKAAANALATSLFEFGVSSFVAHDTIKPMKEWQSEIMNGLMTMEVMIVMLTEDFHGSTWTNQEVGFALGRGIPIIAIKTGEDDPQGFIGSMQALKADYNNLGQSSAEVHKLLVNEIGQEGRLKSILIEAFLSSESYHDAMERLSRLSQTTDRLTDQEFKRIVKGYAENDQLYTCGGIHTRGYWFQRFLETATGKKLEIHGKTISEKQAAEDDEIPF